MKKTLFTCVLLLAGLVLQAQIKGFIGLKSGGHLSSAYFQHTLQNPDIRTTFIPGYHAGVLVKLFTNQTNSLLNAGMQFGPGFTQRGWKQTFRTDEPSFRTQMGYLELPVDAIAYFGHRPTKFFFTVGMYLDYMLSVDAGEVPDPDNLGGAAFYPYDESRDRKFGYGVRVSVGLHRDFSFGTVHLDSFISYSVRSMLEHDTFESGIPDLSNHFAAGFTVAYLLPFGQLDFSDR